MSSDNDILIELLFRRPAEGADCNIVKTSLTQFEEKLEIERNQLPKPQLPRLRLESTSESTCSEGDLPDEVLNEPLVDEVFEESSEDVNIELLFREPTDITFNLTYTIPLMEDVSVKSTEEVISVEKLPSSEELDGVVEEAKIPLKTNSGENTGTEYATVLENSNLKSAETAKELASQEEQDGVAEDVSSKATSGENTVTEEVTVVENPNLDLIQKVTLTSSNTLDGMEDPLEEEVFQEVFVTSVDTPDVDEKLTEATTIPRNHSDYGNDYVPFGTEPSEFSEPATKVEFNNPDDDEEEDEVPELTSQPVRQWKDEDVISLQSLKSLVAEVGCTTEEETLKILKVVPSEPSLMELDISNDPTVIHVPIPLMEPATKYLEDMVDWIVFEAVKEVGEREVVTESQISEMVPLRPVVDEEKTPTPEPVALPKRPPRAPKTEQSKSRFGPLSIKLGRTNSEEQRVASPLSPTTLAEYEHVPMMEIKSVPHSPQEKIEEVESAEPSAEEAEEEKVEQKVIINVFESPKPADPEETKILGTGNSLEYIAKPTEEDDEGSEGLDSIGEISERTIQRFNTSIDDPSVRRDSFSSISSFGDRQKFRTAIENIRQDLLPFQSSVSQYLPISTQLVAHLSMDSPSDLSPNAPPAGYENSFVDRPSAEGSIDSSGFEKVDHEGLDDFPSPIADPMQQSVFGSLQNTDDNLNRRPTTPIHNRPTDDGFVFIEKNEVSEERSKMSSHHDDVIEKNYYGDDAATAKLLESPIAEEARKLVQDAVESASEISKHALEDADEIGRELLDNAEHKVEQVTEPVTDTLHKAYDGLGDFVHETVPKAVDDFVHHVPEEPAPAPVPYSDPEPPVDIHETVDKVHEEIDSFLRGQREPTPPLEDDEEVEPHFGNQTPEEEEPTFNRNGPLTIPEEVERAAQKINDDLADFDPLITSNTEVVDPLTEEEIFGHQKFETVPRPPTPPKDISDEDVKPSIVDLGPAHHHHSHPSSPHHSILKHHGEAWIDFKTVPPCVLDVIYWRDAKKSAIVLSLALLALFVLAKYPLLSVVTYSLLLSLVGAAGFRIFKKVESQIKKTDAEHPFSEILATDLSLPQEKVHAQADVLVEHATHAANTLKKLVFVESPFESLKFGLVLWSLTYVASWFSGVTLAILAVLGVFSVPKVYESNQEAIDPHLATISGHLKNVQDLIDEKLPFLRGAPVAAEEKKEQ